MTPLVFIHGLLGTFDDARLRDKLTRPSLAPDLLGYGKFAHVDPATITIEAQVDHLRALAVAEFGARPLHVVGASVGGAIASLLAGKHPELVASIVNVEGNFTLRDAFWSAAIAKQEPSEVAQALDAWRADPAAWLARSGIAATPELLGYARRWLAQQPATTLQATARSVVATTGAPAYLERVRDVFARVPVHLVAGERSRDGWDVPAWALESAASYRLMPGRGHLMMIEDAGEFATTLERVLTNAAGA